MKKLVYLSLQWMFGISMSSVNAEDFCQAVLQRMGEALRPEQIYFTDTASPNLETFVLVHGLDSAGATFLPVIGPLSLRFRVITLDLRGHGRTADVGKDFSAALLAADLKTLMDYLGISRFHLLGHSMGARVAALYSAAFPEQVQSLVIEDMSFLRRSRRNPYHAARIARKIKDRMPQTFANQATLIAALKPIYRKQAKSISERRARKRTDGSYELLFRPHVSYLWGSQGNHANLDPVFKSTVAPTLVVYPNKHGVLDQADAASVARLRPDVKVVRIPNATHNVHGSNKMGFLAALNEFFDSLKATKP